MSETNDHPFDPRAAIRSVQDEAARRRRELAGEEPAPPPARVRTLVLAVCPFCRQATRIERQFDDQPPEILVRDRCWCVRSAPCENGKGAS